MKKIDFRVIILTNDNSGISSLGNKKFNHY